MSATYSQRVLGKNKLIFMERERERVSRGRKRLIVGESRIIVFILATSLKV